MSYEMAERLLESATTPTERAEAIAKAMALGMPLRLIEEYLDWLDLRHSQESPPRNK